MGLVEHEEHDDTGSVERSLLGFLQRRLPDAVDLRLGDISRVATGLSRENWVFDLSWAEREDASATHLRPLIVRRDPEGGLLDTDRTTEFGVLRALEPTTIPAPRALWLDADGSELGRPSLVMERGTGSCDYFALNGERPLDRRVALAESFADLLADIHLVDWKALGLDKVLTNPGADAAQVSLDEWSSVLRADQVEPLPELELMADWLQAHVSPSPRVVLVHGDFKAGNMLLDDNDDVVLLLDWELARLSDPHEDIGWITQPLRTREHLIPGAWEIDQLLDRYTRRSGIEIDAARIRWWNVMSCFKTAVMQVTGLGSYLADHTDVMYRLTNGCVLAAFDLMES